MTGGDADSNDIPCRTFFRLLRIYEEPFVDLVCAHRNAESFKVDFHDGSEGIRAEERRKNVMLASALCVLDNTAEWMEKERVMIISQRQSSQL